jgi:hypothetical protein
MALGQQGGGGAEGQEETMAMQRLIEEHIVEKLPWLPSLVSSPTTTTSLLMDT